MYHNNLPSLKKTFEHLVVICFEYFTIKTHVFSNVGFKATMIYERCLEERNATLAALSINPLDVTTLPPEGSIITIGNNETHIMPVLPECDLQKELDNVSNF